MPIPSEITALIERLNNELDQVEQEVTQGLNITRLRLASSPDNAILIQLFAYLNNVILFGETLRRRIEYTRIILATDTATNEQIQDIGEDLSEQLGRVLEAKVGVSRVKSLLENWE